ncbi:alpha/beta fold hydrolase, partial [Candidatus Woesearchaeota archaeon]
TTVLFLHGHSFFERNSPEYSVSAFRTLQEHLHAQHVVDAGVITPYRAYVAPEDAWRHMNLTVAGTYYYDAYLRGDSYVLSVATSESIDTYAIRLRDLIEGLRARTGHDITIIAHSMGGLVARRYLQLFGTKGVAQLITIATPHFGLPARAASLCPLFGANKECAEMRQDSAFLAKLNDPARQPQVPITTIAGAGCPTSGLDGDGVVPVTSALLPGAKQYVIRGTCTGTETLHNTLLESDELKEVLYQLIQHA